MIPVHQDNPKDCYRACLASILECLYRDVPSMPPDEEEDWFKPFRLFLQEKNMGIIAIDVKKSPDFVPHGFHMIIGKSPNSPGKRHAAVGYKGVLHFDPTTKMKKMTEEYWEEFEILSLIDPSLETPRANFG